VRSRLLLAVAIGTAILVSSQASATPPSPPSQIPEGAFKPVTIPKPPVLPIFEDFRETPELLPPPGQFAVPEPSPIVVVRQSAPVVVGKPGPTVAEAKAFVYATLGQTQGDCLVSIIRHEDGTWDPYRYSTTGSGAYGIPQALPGSKMASAGDDWRWNRITQIRWMIGYVGKYGSACGAWVFWQLHRWY
jgi:hypothetical protein